MVRFTQILIVKKRIPKWEQTSKEVDAIYNQLYGLIDSLVWVYFARSWLMSKYSQKQDIHLIKHGTCKDKKNHLVPGNLGIYTHELLLNMEPY